MTTGLVEGVDNDARSLIKSDRTELVALKRVAFIDFGRFYIKANALLVAFVKNSIPLYHFKFLAIF